MTYNFAKENNVLAANEEETAPRLGVDVLVIYPFYRVFKHQIGCAEANAVNPPNGL